MKYYAHHGHKDFILCLGYKGEIIKDYFRNYHWNTSDVTLKLGRSPEICYHNHHDEEDWNVTLLDTGQTTQTGGRLRRALAHMSDDNFLMTYGDGLTNSDLNASIRFHEQHGRLATLTAVRPSGRFGELAFDGQTIAGFREKPEQEDAFVNGGFFVLNRRIIDYLDGDDCMFERAPMERLAIEGNLHAFQHPGFWQCMDTYREQLMLDQLFNSGKAPWKVW
jgi:glucose-1-phosphate cytidylyltransferase